MRLTSLLFKVLSDKGYNRVSGYLTSKGVLDSVLEPLDSVLEPRAGIRATVKPALSNHGQEKVVF
jgi:hypothetical protein